jgi:hypothetical protein
VEDSTNVIRVLAALQVGIADPLAFPLCRARHLG